jgi:hypothetical protein
MIQYWTISLFLLVLTAAQATGPTEDSGPRAQPGDDKPGWVPWEPTPPLDLPPEATEVGWAPWGPTSELADDPGYQSPTGPSQPTKGPEPGETVTGDFPVQRLYPDNMATGPTETSGPRRQPGWVPWGPTPPLPLPPEASEPGWVPWGPLGATAPIESTPMENEQFCHLGPPGITAPLGPPPYGVDIRTAGPPGVW